jgi:hypothetical protein
MHQPFSEGPEEDTGVQLSVWGQEGGSFVMRVDILAVRDNVRGFSVKAK